MTPQYLKYCRQHVMGHTNSTEAVKVKRPFSETVTNEHIIILENGPADAYRERNAHGRNTINMSW